MQDNYTLIAESNQRKAHQIVANLGIIKAWENIGAEAHLVGSLSTGLLAKHLDIDFHIYSSPVDVADSFRAISAIAAAPGFKRAECNNLLAAEDECIEWHLWYEDDESRLWQIDMMHIRHGSRWEGHFEQVAERIRSALTDETREAIIRLKCQTPETMHIMGIDYCRAVMVYGVRTLPEMLAWHETHRTDGISEWMP